MINRPDIVIEKIRNKKDKHYVMRKFTGGWTDKQLDTWEIVKLNSPRVNINGKIYFYSLLYDMGYLSNNDVLNVDFVRKLFYYYNQSIPELIKAFNYTYLDFEKESEKILDSKGGISFDGFSFTLDSLSKSINSIGTYAPLYAYVKKQEGSYLICGGRHRVVAINKLIQNRLWNGRKVLCVFWDSYNNNFEYKIGMPNLLIETLLYKLNHLVKEPIDEYFSYITIKNITDLWIVYRIIEREIDFIIEKYENELILNNILPSKIINLPMDVQYDI